MYAAKNWRAIRLLILSNVLVYQMQKVQEAEGMKTQAGFRGNRVARSMDWFGQGLRLRFRRAPQTCFYYFDAHFEILGDHLIANIVTG